MNGQETIIPITYIKESKNMKNWNEYRLIIFDMDGTLYYQRPVQIHMGLRMLWNACISKTGFHEFRTTMKYRKLREEWTTAASSDMEKAQFAMLAQMMQTNYQKAYNTIHKWMYTKPLDLLPKYRDRTLIKKIKELNKDNRKIVIYSDYPVQDKAKAIGLEELACFYGGQTDIGCMKPNPAGIERIVAEYGNISKDAILLVGDRMSKDGLVAEAAGIDYLILKKNKWQRTRQYRDRGIC